MIIRNEIGYKKIWKTFIIDYALKLLKMLNSLMKAPNFIKISCLYFSYKNQW